MKSGLMNFALFYGLASVVHFKMVFSKTFELIANHLKNCKLIRTNSIFQLLLENWKSRLHEVTHSCLVTVDRS